MRCLENLPRLVYPSLLPFSPFQSDSRFSRFSTLVMPHRNNLPLPLAASGSIPSADTSSAHEKEEMSETYTHNVTESVGADEKEEKSETYSNNMTEAMGAVFLASFYVPFDLLFSLLLLFAYFVVPDRHELGMNYNFILPDLIVGSCLQTPEDVDKLHRIGVKTIFCLQQDPDLARDFDAFDLRKRLPAVVSKLYKAIKGNGGVTYIHCTAGLGRAPAVALAYMFWVLGYKLNDAHTLLQSKRSCFPKLDAIKSATADILTGLSKKLVTLSWEDSNCSTVEISGLDIGWGQRIPLHLDDKEGTWFLKRELPEGLYEYKYIIDGEWTCNKDELLTSPNKDGHVNNFVQVLDNTNSVRASLRERLTGDDPDLTKEERLRIKEFLETFPNEDQ
ncbi:hypothetical protein VNO78_19909 [Psophocarpus tetragonolobus]|uniref:Uncharacterized protein n=1 Tax=Psophocarpus tetragonolobus TaxID=3891 RepID=A0AAN9XH20_PSOTE